MAENAAPRALDVRDWRVLATASGGGIGRAVARAFAASGASVHIADLDEAAAAASGFSATMGDAVDPDRDITGQAISVDGHVEYL